tara:strand:- start:1001 stop:2254 length:1254 start_codon:yes stop_codon:yes gene_type:complete
MAVPTTGSLSLLGIFSEKNEDDYTASNTDGESNFSLRGLSSNSHNDSTGGNININTNSSSYPDSSNPYAMSEFYGYDHDTVGLSFNIASAIAMNIFRFFTTPSPNNCSVSLSTTSALGTVQHTPVGGFTVTGSPTKRGTVTSTSPNPTVTQTTINNAVNSWALCSSGTMSNGFMYGITYYTRIWASKGLLSNTIYTDQVEWNLRAAATVTTQAASTITSPYPGFQMNGNITDVGLGTNPASGAVNGIVARGFLISTSNTVPTYYGQTGNTISQNSGSMGVFNTGSYSKLVQTSTAGTYYIRAFVMVNETNTSAPAGVADEQQISYGSVVQLTIVASRVEIDITNGTFSKPAFACYQATTASAFFPDFSPAVGDVVYTTLTGSTKLGTGNWGVNILDSQSNRRMTIGSNGVITAFQNC